MPSCEFVEKNHTVMYLNIALTLFVVVFFSLEILTDCEKMTMTQTAMVLCVLGTSLLLTMPDKTTATDKFFQTGGRFGKRYDERISGTARRIYSL